MSARMMAQKRPSPVASPSPARGNVLLRRCACGGTLGPTSECVECRRKKRLGVGGTSLQPKLRIGRADDPLEREADRVAEQVMRMPEPDLQHQRDEEDELSQAKPLVQRRVASTEGGLEEAPPIVHEVLLSPGRPLDPATRAFFEPRFGHDFSEVRVHTDTKAAQSARLVSARAFTVGQDIVFGSGQYGPRRRELLAHELTHVIQQFRGHYPSSVPNREPLVRHSVVQPRIMRSQIFASTLQICHQYLRSRTFRVSHGGLRVVVNSYWGPEEESDPMPYGCSGDRPFSIELRDVGLIFDSGWGACEFAAGEPSYRQWTNLPTGNYYLNINTPDTGPYCCLRGSVEVFQESNISGKTCTQPPTGPLEILHDALAVAGLIPALGVVPDAVDAGIYVIQGEWASAGLSAVAMIPIFGDAASVGRVGARTVLRIEGRAVRRIGRERIIRGIRAARAPLGAAIRSIPQGFTERQFWRFARGVRRLRKLANLPDGELVIHGSRVIGTARTTSDIDIALRVDDTTFFELAERVLGRARRGTRLRAAILDRIRRNGQLSSFDLGVEFQSLRRKLVDAESPVPVQFSVLKIGGRLDTGPFLSL